MSLLRPVHAAAIVAVLLLGTACAVDPASPTTRPTADPSDVLTVETRVMTIAGVGPTTVSVVQVDQVVQRAAGREGEPLGELVVPITEEEHRAITDAFEDYAFASAGSPDSVCSDSSLLVVDVPGVHHSETDLCGLMPEADALLSAIDDATGDGPTLVLPDSPWTVEVTDDSGTANVVGFSGSAPVYPHEFELDVSAHAPGASSAPRSGSMIIDEATMLGVVRALNAVMAATQADPSCADPIGELRIDIGMVFDGTTLVPRCPHGPTADLVAVLEAI